MVARRDLTSRSQHRDQHDQRTTHRSIFYPHAVREGESCMYSLWLLRCLGFPPKICLILCTVFQHAVTDFGNVACNAISCIMLGNAVAQQILVVLADWVLSTESCYCRRLVHCFECMIVAR